MSLIKKVQENIFHHQLFKPGAKIAVGVSGGPDSVCLLDALYKLRKKYNLQIIIAHVNYGLRGKDSEKDEVLVRKLAEKYSLPLEKIRIANHKLQITEDYLRNLRYDFFSKVQKKHRVDFIAVGHNLNDQAETVLMRILRGTGLRGLAAIRFSTQINLASKKRGEVDKITIIRPLLNISREEILAYLRKYKIPFRIDKTNLEIVFFRNKIRHQLLPQLKKEYNPKIQEALYRLSQSAADDYDFINKYSSEWLKINKTLTVSKLIKLHPAIQREVIRLSIEKYIPNLHEIELGHIDEILKVIKSKKNKQQFIKFKKLKIHRKGDKLIMSKTRNQK